MCDMGLRLAPSPKDPIASHLLMLEEVRRGALDFDIIHVHVDLLHYALLRDHAARCLTTMHGRLDLPLLVRMHELFDEFPLVSISEHQRIPIPDANWVGTVHHGLPLDLLPFSARDDGYLAFLGRISPEKRPDRAIEIAVRAGAPLENRGKNRSRRHRILGAEDRAAGEGGAECRIYRRDRRAREGFVSRRRPGAAVPHRLAGAVRPRHDRGAGLRRPGDRLPARLRARSHRGWRHRISGEIHRRGRQARR